jgi:hypothetical protein
MLYAFTGFDDASKANAEATREMRCQRRAVGTSGQLSTGKQEDMCCVVLQNAAGKQKATFVMVPCCQKGKKLTTPIPQLCQG